LGTDKFIYKYSATEFRDLLTLIVQNVEIEQHYKLKLPIYYENKCLVTKKSFEQSTSEQLALFKSTIFSGNEILILTGGLGIDEWAFSKSFDKVTSLDIDFLLNEIVRYNFENLDIKNILRLDQSAEDFLTKTSKKYDLVYIDPDRRVDNKREILLKNHLPNVFEILPLIQSISERLLIKCSPMYDFEMALKEIDGIKTIFILSVKGEVKEMLLDIDLKHHTSEQASIKCLDFVGQIKNEYDFLTTDNTQPQQVENMENYFYEVGSSIVKVRKHHHYANLNNLKLIDSKTSFYTSNQLINNFIGRVFKTLVCLPFSVTLLKNYLKENDYQYINLKVRGMPFKTESVFQKLKVKEGGEEYFFVFPMNGKAVFVHTQKT
jgi:hypothetical protein